MEGTPERSRALDYFEHRVERKGLRPRLAAAVIAILWLTAIVVFGIVEHLIDPESFENVWYGMWWATQTVTTVGYGDYVPAQTDGYIIATVLMVGGLSFFAVITGAITSLFVARAAREHRVDPGDPVIQRLTEITAELEGVKAELARLNRTD